MGAYKKIILYAPTWRENEFKKVGQYKFKFQFDL
ncbi:CDP-glycerol glycerophosphotransferase family protein [Bacillus halotolerans]|nr:CDP-glycerol glycerophosphotransferase family protein [Bacillus halotolerans]